MKILILGVNGFIGNALTRRILTSTDWEVYGLDMSTDKLEHSMGHPRFHFLEGDITLSTRNGLPIILKNAMWFFRLWPSQHLLLM